MVLSCVKPSLEWCYVNQNKKTHIKMHYSTVQSMKSAAVLIEDGAFALFLCPCHRAFGSSSAPAPGNLPCKAKKKANYSGGLGEGAWCTCNWLMHKLANTVEPWDNEPPYNKVLGSTNNFLYPSNSKIYGKGPWCKEHPLIIRFSVPRPFVILRFHCSIFGDW